MAVIVDTNVALVASGRFEDASKNCVATCAEKLGQINSGEMKLALDDQRRIIEEYRGKLNADGQPAIGDVFLKWVEINWTNPERCDLVSITPVDGLDNEFEEFPDDPALKDFDPDDWKFIAVALAHPQKPPILQAVDSKWWDFRDALHQHRVRVEFICKDDIQRLRGA